MARTKKAGGNKAKRQTLDEVRALPGKYLVVTCTEGGGYGVVSSLRPRFAGDSAPPDVNILPHEPQIIDERWLDDPNFIRLYESRKDIVLVKTDVIPSPRDLYALPPDIEAKLTPRRKMIAYQIARTPASDKTRLLIDATNVDAEKFPQDREMFELGEVVPFLNAIEVYEKRFDSRPAVLKAIDARRKAIEEHRREVTRW